jgi:hypothetical protein
MSVAGGLTFNDSNNSPKITQKYNRNVPLLKNNYVYALQNNTQQYPTLSTSNQNST